MKQCKPNPWVEFGENYKKGDKVSGQIKSITDFGVFIGLPGGIDGLVHLSDLSWDVPGEEAVRNYKKGEELETTVLAIDPERERISLGVKQLDKDPLSLFLGDHPKGSIVSGVVQELDAKLATRRARWRHDRPSARFGDRARSRRGRAHGAQGRRDGRSEDHGRRSQDAHHLAVDQGQGSPRRAAGAPELQE